MQFGFLKDNEPRVSITPSTLDKFISLGHKVFIEKMLAFNQDFLIQNIVVLRFIREKI